MSKILHLHLPLGSPNDLPIFTALCCRDRHAMLCREARHQKRQTCDIRCSATTLSFGWVGSPLTWVLHTSSHLPCFDMGTIRYVGTTDESICNHLSGGQDRRGVCERQRSCWGSTQPVQRSGKTAPTYRAARGALKRASCVRTALTGASFVIQGCSQECPDHAGTGSGMSLDNMVNFLGRVLSPVQVT